MVDFVGAESESQPFGTQSQTNPELIGSVTEVQEEGIDASRISRIGNYIISLPERINNGVNTAAIAFRAEPLHYTKRVIQSSIVGAEVSFLNEAVRYGALAAVLSNTSGGWALGAATLGATTFLVEAPAALATAELLNTDSSNRALTKVNNWIDRHFHRNFKMNTAVEIGAGMLGGSAVVLVEKQREDQTRTIQQNRRHGIFTAGWMSAYFSLEGAFIGMNSHNGEVLNAKTIGAAALALGITAMGSSAALKRSRLSNIDSEKD